MKRTVKTRNSIFRIRDSARHGYTLIEVVVSLGTTAMLMLGICSAMMFAARAMPDAKSPTSAIVNTGGVLEQLVTELQYAVTVTSRSATMIEFTVADRDANGLDETIRYEWSGTGGSPLTRKYNAQTAVPVLDDVREFALTYDLAPLSSQGAEGNESAEMILANCNITIGKDDYPIGSQEWHGQYFRPTLPADTVTWKVTRVRLRARKDGTAVGESRIQLQQPTAGKLPSGTVIEETVLPESSLPGGYHDHDFVFGLAGGLAPSQGLCVVVKWISDTSACQLSGLNKDASTADSFMVTSTDGGSSWTAPAGMSLHYTIFGTVTTSGTPPTGTMRSLARVRIRLREGADTQGTLQAAVRPLNRPEVPQ